MKVFKLEYPGYTSIRARSNTQGLELLKGLESIPAVSRRHVGTSHLPDAARPNNPKPAKRLQATKPPTGAQTAPTALTQKT